MSEEEMKFEDYKRFFEEMPVGLIRTDLKTGEILLANQYAAQLFGFDTVEELKSKIKTVDVYPMAERRKLIQKIRKQGQVQGYEIKLNLSGKTVYLSAHLKINCGGTCIEGTLLDITELVQLRNQQLMLLKEVGRQIDTKIATLAS